MDWTLQHSLLDTISYELLDLLTCSLMAAIFAVLPTVVFVGGSIFRTKRQCSPYASPSRLPLPLWPTVEASATLASCLVVCFLPKLPVWPRSSLYSQETKFKNS